MKALHLFPGSLVLLLGTVLVLSGLSLRKTTIVGGARENAAAPVSDPELAPEGSESKGVAEDPGGAVPQAAPAQPVLAAGTVTSEWIDPRSPFERGIVSLRTEGGWLTMVYTRSQGLAPGFGIGAQGSRDMENWNSATLDERVLRTEEGVETVEARLPMAGGREGFLGIEYTSAQP